MTSTHGAHLGLVDVTRLEEAALIASRSAEALFGYLSRLDDLRDAQPSLGGEALAERAAEAEMNTRVVLSAGVDAANELQDLGLLEHALRTNAGKPEAFNEIALSDAVAQIADVLRDRMPTQRWEWLTTAKRLVADVDVRIETDGEGLRGTVTYGGQTRVVCLDPGVPATRVSTRAFFSAESDRVYAPTSAMFGATDKTLSPASAYDAMIGGMALTREWVYRHARNAAELGPAERTGGGPVVAVIIIVLVVVSAVAAVTAGILAFVCVLGSDTACKWSAYLGLLASVLGGSAKVIDANSGQKPILQYGTNPQ